MARARRALKRAIKRGLIAVLRLVTRPFFDTRYLRGRWFDDSLVGWNWALAGIFWQRILGFNRRVRWPMAPFSRAGPNIDFHPDDLNNFQHFGCYFQTYGHITLGRGTWIAPNVGIITANHDTDCLDDHPAAEEVVIGERCWIAMNAVVLPGVHLGPRTVVGAGAVVTKSFPEGYCVLGGVPARAIRQLPRDDAASAPPQGEP